MPTIVLTSHLATQAGGTTFEVVGSTVREMLEALFTTKPTLRSYLLDDQGTLRHHVTAFVDGQVVRDKSALNDPVSADGELFILQALSGG